VIVGWAADRCIAKWTDRTASKWERLAGAAARQSRRSWWPRITGPASTADVAERCAAAAVALVLHEEATASLSAVPIPASGDVVIVVGPEGGITDAELAAFAAAGAQAVRLGRTVVRSSTAGVAALAVICAGSRWR
jgi:16S rRNA (uracil1498-N3)-methyltransferase